MVFQGETIKQAYKQKLIDAATRLISDKGLRGVSIRDIAKEAELNHSLIFRYFGSYEQLVVEVFNKLSNQLAETMETRDLRDYTDRGKFLNLFNQLVEEPQILRLLIYSLLDGKKLFQDKDRAGFKTVVSLFEEGKQLGQVNTTYDAQLLALTMPALVLGWSLIDHQSPELIGDARRTSKSIRKDVLELWLKALQ